ncbi:MAG: DUF1064 domain-containing protein [Phycisphaerales bacterium]
MKRDDLPYLTTENLAKLRKRSKYKVSAREARTLDGTTYDSKTEMRRARQLMLAKQCGVIVDWSAQPEFHLGCAENVYRADFLVTDRDGKHVEDVKGCRTAKFNHDVKLWKKYGELPLHILTENGSGWTREIIKGKA